VGIEGRRIKRSSSQWEWGWKEEGQQRGPEKGRFQEIVYRVQVSWKAFLRMWGGVPTGNAHHILGENLLFSFRIR
jgi:hypothetical protein